MLRSLPSAGLFLLLCGLAQAQKPLPLISQTHPNALPLSQVATLPTASLPGPVRVTPATGGTFEDLDAKSQLWRLRIRRPGVAGIQVSFATLSLPQGAELWIYAAHQGQYHMPFTDRNNPATRPLHVPALATDDLVIELNYPRSVAHFVDVELSRVEFVAPDPMTLASGGSRSLRARQGAVPVGTQPTPGNGPQGAMAGCTQLVRGANGIFDNIGYGATIANQCVYGWPVRQFCFTAEVTAPVTVDTCQPSPLPGFLDTVIDVRDDCNSFNLIACDNNACGQYSSVTWNAVQGHTYCIEVHPPGFGEGLFLLNVTAPPANDVCSNAIPLSPGLNGPFENRDARDSAPWSCGGSAAHDVWFRVDSPCTGPVTIETCGNSTNFDTKMAVFGGDCNALTPITCNDDACSLQSRVSFQGQSGQSYWIAVGGYNGAEGDFDLVMSCTHDNDECSGALEIFDGTNDYSNVGATDSSTPWTCGGTASHDVWFYYQAIRTGDVSIDTCSGTSFDTKIAVYDGSCQGTELACNDDTCGLQSRVTFATTAGSRYYVRVGGYNGREGNFRLTVRSPGNYCEQAITLQPGTNAPFDLYGATASGQGVNSGVDLWFQFTPARSGLLTAVALGIGGSSSRWDETLYEGTCGNLRQLSGRTILEVPVLAGSTYLIQVVRYLGPGTTFKFDVSLDNDDCIGATFLARGVNGPFDNSAGTTSSPPMPCGSNPQRDLWFVKGILRGTSMTITTCSAQPGMDPVLEVFEGGCESLTPIGCNDDWGTCGLGSLVRVPPPSNTTHLYIRVASYGSSPPGPFYITVDESPGDFNTLTPSCAGLTLEPRGYPIIGGAVGWELREGSTSTVPPNGRIFLGLTPIAIPMCRSCTLGTPLDVWFGTAIIPQTPIPNDGVLIGGRLYFQGIDFGNPGGGCETPFRFRLSETIEMIIGG